MSAATRGRFVWPLGLLLLAGAGFLGAFLLGAFERGAEEGAPKTLEARRGRGGDLPAQDPAPPGARPQRLATKAFPAARRGAPCEISLGKEGVSVAGHTADPKGRPLAGVSVELLAAGRGVPGGSPPGAPLARVTSSPSGRFAFLGVDPSGQYVLLGSHPAFAQGWLPLLELDHKVSRAHAILRLRVGLAVTGLVTTADGRPLGGADVAVYDRELQAIVPEGGLERRSHSDQAGRFRIANLRPGWKRILVHLQGYATTGRESFSLDSKRGRGDLGFVLHRGYRLSGLVVRMDNGQPIPGALVKARPVRFNAPARNALQRAPSQRLPTPRRLTLGRQAEGAVREAAKGARAVAAGRQRPNPFTGPVGQRAFLVARARSDLEGRFDLAGLMPAVYALAVEAPGYQALQGIDFPAGNRSVRLVLWPLPGIRGRVIDGETGQPVSSFVLGAVCGPEAFGIPPPLRQHVEDPAGAFTYKKAPGGKVYLLALAPGYAGGRAGPLRLVPGKELEGVEIAMQRGARLEGRVTDAAGDGIAGARVRLRAAVGQQMGAWRRGSSPSWPDIRGPRLEVLSGQDGSFVMPTLLSGRYLATVSHPDYVLKQSGPLVLKDRLTRVLPDLILARGGSIRGRVRGPDGSPDSAAVVMARGAGGAQFPKSRAATDKQGRFEIRGLEPGSYEVLLTQHEGRLQLQDPPKKVVEIKAGATIVVEF